LLEYIPVPFIGTSLLFSLPNKLSSSTFPTLVYTFLISYSSVNPEEVNKSIFWGSLLIKDIGSFLPAKKIV
jgi:hypothetical protein